MVRLLVLYEQPRDEAEFDRHYREVHIPLAKALPGLRRYTVGRGPRPVRGGRPCYLVGELDWDDMAALEHAFTSPEGRATAADMVNLSAGGVRSMVYAVEDV
jgi:uncharacterized protein (TIGR02118 family)